MTLICLIYCAEFGCHKFKFVVQVWCSGLPIQIAGRLWRSNTDCSREISSKNYQQNVLSVPCCTPGKIWAFLLEVTCKCSAQHPKLLRVRWESDFSLAIILLDMIYTENISIIQIIHLVLLMCFTNQINLGMLNVGLLYYYKRTPCPYRTQ